MSILYYREENPFRREFTNVIAYVAQAAILITFYSALSIETGIMVDFGLSDLGMGIFLVLVNISVFGLLLHVSLQRLRAEQKRNALKHAHASGLEYAVGFSAEKFATTFDAVSHTVVPASHTLVFHYTTVFGARRALKSGIPAHSKVGGVLVSDKRPHELSRYDVIFFTKFASFTHKKKEPPSSPPTTAAAAAKNRLSLSIPTSPSPFPSASASVANDKNDKNVTNELEKDNEEDDDDEEEHKFEAVLAISIPTRILQCIKTNKFETGEEEGPEERYRNLSTKANGLYYIPSELLNALRPTSFTNVIDPAPWADGLVLLSPTPIIRGYQIKKYIHHYGLFDLNKDGIIRKEKWLGKDFASDVVHFSLLNQKRQDSFLEMSIPLGISLDDTNTPSTAATTLTTTNTAPNSVNGVTPSSALTTPSSSMSSLDKKGYSKSADSVLTSSSSPNSTNHHSTMKPMKTKNTLTQFDENVSHSSSEIADSSPSIKPIGEKDTSTNSDTMSTPFIPPSIRKKMTLFRQGVVTQKNIVVERPELLTDYISRMRTIRRRCAASDKVPLYHYTQLSVAQLILKTGLRMSRQGQGDGGVYFSTLGPCSYGLGSSELGSNEVYEEMIIKDCFGVERMDEYKGKDKLDVVIVYGISPLALQPAPGGRDNAKVVTKATFQDLSLPHEDGNFFLHPSAILGSFLIRTSNPLECDAQSLEEAESEVLSDEAIRIEIDQTLTRLAANTAYFASKDTSSAVNTFLKRK
eukprot:CAMPEP_0114330758 /NCGR_PEP_ID=MMETSP0101-20121206/1966_1 /TAXON_ID=38822 ORGANISM="Pteridomonas danica, Strain PT" /NCGR_SAMPLE_ID=MMETSP0101 /ASSEMBLY_ACC=CAM_ASM_000211 /LENGTH=748 /DNA_ID=CAMNT_0001460879 /DNA_START=458 /DNA_END=2704 /DNA_ORIENTATION=+